MRELALIFEEHGYAEAAAHNDRMHQAWNTAALTKTKKLPDLKTLQVRVGPAKPRRQQSMEDQIAAAKAWQAASR